MDRYTLNPYVRRLGQPRTLFWIEGIPGSGKSWLGTCLGQLGLVVVEADLVLSRSFQEWLDETKGLQDEPDAKQLDAMQVDIMVKEIQRVAAQDKKAQDIIVVGCTVNIAAVLVHMPYPCVRCMIRFSTDSFALFDPESQNHRVREAVSDERQRVFRRVTAREVQNIAQRVQEMQRDIATLPIGCLHVGLVMRHLLAIHIGSSFAQYNEAYSDYMAYASQLAQGKKRKAPSQGKGEGVDIHLRSRGAILELILRRQLLFRNLFYLGTDLAPWDAHVHGRVSLSEKQVAALRPERWLAALDAIPGGGKARVVQGERQVEDSFVLDRSTFVYTLLRQEGATYHLVMTEFIPSVRDMLHEDYATPMGSYHVKGAKPRG
jgi:hypothetical protein